MLRRPIYWICGCTVLFLVAPAGGYELETHARMSAHAFSMSRLGTDTSLWKSLGFDSPNEPLEKYYYDLSDGRVARRERSKDQNAYMQKELQKGQELTPKGWLMYGAVREDDYVDSDGHQVPPGDVDLHNGTGLRGRIADSRPLNHFYNPVKDEPLSVPFISPARAPIWAIGFERYGTGRNHFTVRDAREAMYRALTGKSRDDSLPPQNTREERTRYWATAFRALGDVIHLVQDMAQPQHTRDDRHAGENFEGQGSRLLFNFYGHKSVYEAYTEARAACEKLVVSRLRARKEPLVILTDSLDYSGYPLPALENFRAFFTTRNSDECDDVTARRGLADYSARSFYSAGTNLDNSPQEKHCGYPQILGHAQTTRSYRDWANAPLPDGASVKMLLANIPDSHGNMEEKDVPITTEGLFDQFLLERLKDPAYTLTRENYDAMARLLVPRAVAYSAALLDHFFRGQVEFEILPTCVIRNPGAEKLNGRFEFFYDDGSKARRTVMNKDGRPARWWLKIEGKDANGKIAEAHVGFAPADGFRPSDGRYLLVFDGTMGNEKNVVIGNALTLAPGVACEGPPGQEKPPSDIGSERKPRLGSSPTTGDSVTRNGQQDGSTGGYDWLKWLIGIIFGGTALHHLMR